LLSRFINPLYVWSKIKVLKNQWNYCDSASEYEEENITEATKMIDELYPPWAPCTPPSPSLEGGEDPFLDLLFS
jgi:hypothetical protein